MLLVTIILPVPRVLSDKCDEILGRRVRKMKEKFAVTEMRRQANRVRFGEIGEDIYQTSVGFGVGSLNKEQSSGKVRNPAMDKKTQVSISKRLQVILLIL